jgi:guanosine-3',5'-bis(diphosphate) 3'-pyrophosphohydrolase
VRITPLVGRSPLVDRALAVAAWAHRSQSRRSVPAPYVEHCVAVAQVLLDHDIGEERILAAALLHDVLEDTDLAEDDLAALFGAEVVALVRALTEDGSADHDARKAEHLDRLAAAPPEALLLFAADKLVGARDLATRLRAPESKDWPELSGPLDEKLANLRAACRLATRAGDAARVVFAELAEELDRIEAYRALRP